MTIPERTPLAVDHGLNMKRITALVELYKTGETDAHGQTLKSLRSKGLVGAADDQDGKPYLTEHGREVAQGLIELDDAAKEDEAVAPEDREKIEDPVVWEATELPDDIPTVTHDQEAVDSEESFICPREAEQVVHRIRTQDSAAVFDGTAALFPAAHQVLCRGRRSGEHSRLIAVVVGSESDAQRVADQWNLTHLADIAAHADATFAVAVPAEVGVYLFERFAVVEH